MAIALTRDQCSSWESIRICIDERLKISMSSHLFKALMKSKPMLLWLKKWGKSIYESYIALIDPSFSNILFTICFSRALIGTLREPYSP